MTANNSSDHPTREIHFKLMLSQRNRKNAICKIDSSSMNQDDSHGNQYNQYGYTLNQDPSRIVQQNYQQDQTLTKKKLTNFSVDYILHELNSHCGRKKDDLKKYTHQSFAGDISNYSSRLNHMKNIYYPNSQALGQFLNTTTAPNFVFSNQLKARYDTQITSLDLKPSVINLQSKMLRQNLIHPVPSSHSKKIVDENKTKGLLDEHDRLTRSGRDINGPHAVNSSSTSKRLNHSFHQRYPCKICQKSFANPHCLSRHIRIHTGEKPYQCNICKKAFNQSFHLTIHKRLHTGDLRYQCNICCRRFVQSNDLKKHYRTHTGEKPYHCSYCQKCFADASQLKKHMRIHTGEKPYRCIVCQRRFTQSGALKKHSHIHQ
ncbi:Protein glass [Trichoplax sp. H2]|nr:Protein glass [Trichoplax sp. H2]|eukprot:RDD37397.1 Protein glass [Trichoplax sp. H2]